MIKFIIWLFTWKRIDTPPPRCATHRPGPAARAGQTPETPRYDLPTLRAMTLAHLQSRGRDGDTAPNINAALGSQLAAHPDRIAALLRDSHFASQLARAREVLAGEKLIGFNRKTSVWYPVRPAGPGALTEKEYRFLKWQGLGEGWQRVSEMAYVPKWLHQNLSSQQFELFCVNILAQHCGVPVRLTNKRPYSGADGGFDAVGTYDIDGETFGIAVQVKQYRPDRQIGTDHLQKLVGALVENGLRHGFLITTGRFSERVIASLEKYARSGIQIELIDQNRLVAIMLEKGDQPHGFGLHRTAKGLTYINETILRQAAGA